jgi:DNA-binding PucR family transcriptional regulator
MSADRADMEEEAMTVVDHDDSAVAEQVAALAARMSPQLIELTLDIRELIQAQVPALRGDERVSSLLEASVRENVDTMTHLLRHGIPIDYVDAPNAALEYGRVLAQRDVAVAALVRAYRVGQTRFLRRCLEDLLQRMGTDQLEGAATIRIVERVSDCIDRIVEQVVAAYGLAREEWLQHRGALVATRVLSLLTERNVDIDAAESRLGGYRIRQSHLGAVIWAGDPIEDTAPLTVLRRFTDAVAQAAACVQRPLFVPYDELTAWLWMPLDGRGQTIRSEFENALGEAHPSVFVALGEPAKSLEGFRRTHRQALGAHAVALAAGQHRARLTPFIEVAPLAMMCADLDSAHAWVAETLGGLAVDDERRGLLRETARVFLATGGSYAATADQLTLHRNTAQYRVQKAEEFRGRPLREARLDVELALLACHWLGRAVLQSGPAGHLAGAAGVDPTRRRDARAAGKWGGARTPRGAHPAAT